MEVIYNGQTVVSSDVRKDDVLVEKGGTLEMILSKESGGSLSMPDLTCKSFDEAAFLLQTLNLIIGEQVSDGSVSNVDASYIYDQEPAPDGRVYTGDTIKIFLTQNKPDNCDEN